MCATLQQEATANDTYTNIVVTDTGGADDVDVEELLKSFNFGSVRTSSSDSKAAQENELDEVSSQNPLPLVC